jgi:hypothetical protein
MSVVNGGRGPSQRGKSQGLHDKRSIIKERARETMARDDLEKSFAGDENRGPAGNPKETSVHDTHVRNRKSARDNHPERPDSDDEVLP